MTRSCRGSTTPLPKWAGSPKASSARRSRRSPRATPSLPRTSSKSDPKVDQLERELDNLAIRLLALRQPVARDLREIFAALKIASDLERIADYAANVAKRSIALSQTPPVRPVYALPRMAHLAQLLIKDVLDAYVQRDADKAYSVWIARCRARRDVFEPVSRAADLHDGRSTQHRPVHASAVHGQEHRANRRSRDQYRRKSVLPGERNTARTRRGRKATSRASKS